MNLGDLLFLHVEKLKGEKVGLCVLCGEKAKGLPIKEVVSDNFTAWEFLNSGNIFCETCASVYKSDILRRKSWIVNREKLIVFKNDEAEKYLFNPTEPPFFIHIAKKGQKQTWITMFNMPAYNPNNYFFTYENYNYGIHFEKDKATKYISIIKELLKKKVTKTELYSAQFKSKIWEKAIKEGFENLLLEAQKYIKNPLWVVMVDVARI